MFSNCTILCYFAGFKPEKKNQNMKKSWSYVFKETRTRRAKPFAKLIKFSDTVIRIKEVSKDNQGHQSFFFSNIMIYLILADNLKMKLVRDNLFC